MQDEDQKLNDLSPETVKKAIEAVKSRAWDINPFTVADELKVSRAAIYRHAGIMKIIIAARGGSFGMDVQTSLDLAWQLRQLELQNNELKEKLATSGSHRLDLIHKSVDEITANGAANEGKETDRPGEAIFNLANNNGPPMSTYFNQLERLLWKDIETVYYFKVASLKDQAKNLLDINDQSDKLNNDSAINVLDSHKSSISYDSLISIEANKRLNQASSISPFARLKSGSLGPDKTQKDLGSEQKTKEYFSDNTSVSPPIESLLPFSSQPILRDKSQEIDEQLLQNSEHVGQTEKRVEKLESDLVHLASQLHNDIAERIRINLENQTEEASSQIKAETAPIDSGSGLRFESVKTPTESEGWQKFETQLPPLGEESVVIETPNQDDLLLETPLPIQDDKEPDIKLIPLLRSQMPPPSPNVDLIIEESAYVVNELAQNVADTGDGEIVSKEINSSLKEDNAVPRDELRDLIQSHIRNAAEQMAEFPHSIGTGKEFEVWLNNPARSKFVGSTKTPETNRVEEEEIKSQPKQMPFIPRVVPPEVRKACLILGLRPDNITYEVVQEAWKKSIVAPGVHPDLGGDTELAVYLNTAKDVLMRFLDAQAPKLGKKFGPFRTEKDGKTKTEKPKNEQ